MDHFIKRWNFTRSETLEILNSLGDEQLLFKPEGEVWQPLYYQFACIARTQLVYANAARTGKMDFSLLGSPDMPNKHEYKTHDSLVSFLNEANDRWLTALDGSYDHVNWGNDSKPVEVHIMSLAEHERMHHGQLISYFTLAGYALPSGFKSNWSL